MNKIIELIDEFRNKGCAWQSQNKAESILNKLKKLIEYDDWFKLYLAHNHYKLGEGVVELFDVCKELKVKYFKIYSNKKK